MALMVLLIALVVADELFTIWLMVPASKHLTTSTTRSPL